jgi:hypothetical protein
MKPSTLNGVSMSNMKKIIARTTTGRQENETKKKIDARVSSWEHDDGMWRQQMKSEKQKKNKLNMSVEAEEQKKYVHAPTFQPPPISATDLRPTLSNSADQGYSAHISH